MTAHLFRAAALLLLVSAPPAAAQDVSKRVDRLLSRAPVIDGHNDLAWEIRERHGAEGRGGRPDAPDTDALPVPLQTDIARLRKGHVGAQFWSVYIPADTTGPRAVEMTLEEIDIVRRFVAANPQAFAMATTAADIRRIEKAGRDRRPDRGSRAGTRSTGGCRCCANIRRSASAT